MAANVLELRTPAVSGLRTTGLPHLQSLFASKPAKRIEPNVALYLDAEPNALFEVVSGCVRRYAMRSDGRRSIIAFSFADEYCGCSLEGPNPLAAEAVTPVMVRRIDRFQLRAAIAQKPHLEAELLQLAWRELEDARAHMAVLGSNGAVSKVASFLLSCAARLPSRDGQTHVLDLPMPRLDIADFLGLTIESVSRALTRLRLSGCISLRSTSRVIFEDIAALRDIADELPRNETRLPSRIAYAPGDARYGSLCSRRASSANRSNSSANSSHP